MEDLKTILVQSEDYLMSSSDETDDENLSILQLERQGGDVPLASINWEMGVHAKALKKRNGEQRLPTRRPDPNVYNRNALLARENRRKKKMYLETIEKELQDARNANRTLLKALKRQSKVSRRLEQEKKYFQSLFENRSEILSLFTAIKNCGYGSLKSPFSSTSNSDYDNTYSCKVDPYTSSSSSSSRDPDPLSIDFENPSDGSVTVENPSYSSDFSSFDFCTFPDFFTDFEDTNCSNLPNSTGWDDLWNNDVYHNNAVEDLSIPTSSQREEIVRAVYVDHSYVAASTPDLIQTSRQQNDIFSTSLCAQSSPDIKVGSDNDTTGVCFHIAGSNVSMDFCPTCNWNSNNRTPPLQLLNE